MTSAQLEDSGREFEDRALAIARAIHDPSGLQGPLMFQGREHDGLFIDEISVTAYEFTTMRTKDKAVKDATKLRDLLRAYAGLPQNRHKSAVGYFVTAIEPTAEQRGAVEKIAREGHVQIHAISAGILRKRLIDAERYLELRRAAPFGSTTYALGKGDAVGKYVEPTISSKGQGPGSISELAAAVASGRRVILIADYGAGKSTAMQRVFEILRKRYFKEGATARVPVHINLRDCYGLKSPTEVLRRHAEDIGYSGDASLVSTWRSGNVDLILDGFDEVVPSRWTGSARDLRVVRKQALVPVRRLIEETPQGSGVVVAGRPQYFAGEDELRETLGFSDVIVSELEDFSDTQVEEYLGVSTSSLPEWLPSRPLLLNFIVQQGFVEAIHNSDPEVAWLGILQELAAREARNVSSITRENVERLLCRIATVARMGGSQVGPITINDMSSVYSDVCGYEPDEEGLQLLLRLPGLATVQGASTEERRLIDTDLAEATFGRDLYYYMIDPYTETHPLSKRASWTFVSPGLAPGLAAASLTADRFEPSHAASVVKRRMDLGQYDAITYDCAATADVMGAQLIAGSVPQFQDLLLERVTLTGERDFLSAAVFSGCVIEALDVLNVHDGAPFPTFQQCLIGKIDGWSSVPSRFAHNFRDCDIEGFSGEIGTTAGLLGAGQSELDAIALTVLKKVYMQKGGGRKLSALSRGLPLHQRGEVSPIVEALVSVGYVQTVQRKAETLVVAVKGRGAHVRRLLEQPGAFALDDL